MPGVCPGGGGCLSFDLTDTLPCAVVLGKNSLYHLSFIAKWPLHNNSPHGKFHRFLFPFSSRFSDLNFASYVLYIYLCYVACHTQWAWVTYGLLIVFMLKFDVWRPLYTVQDLVNKMKKLQQKYKQEKDKSSRSGTGKRKKWKFFEVNDRTLCDISPSGNPKTLTPGPRTTPTDPSTDHLQNKI